MKTVPNQKVVKVQKEKCGQGNLYAAINLTAMENAAQTLDAGAFKLWIYFSKNQNDYEFALSSTDAKNRFGIGKSQYDTAIKKLIEKGYLVHQQGNHYTFYEIPIDNDQTKEPFHQNHTTPLDENRITSLNEKDIRNNTYIPDNQGKIFDSVSAEASSFPSFQDFKERDLHSPLQGNDKSTLLPFHEWAKTLKALEPETVLKQCYSGNKQIPIRHIRDYVIQYPNGICYRIVDYDCYNYNRLMEYADWWNNQLVRYGGKTRKGLIFPECPYAE